MSPRSVCNDVWVGACNGIDENCSRILLHVGVVSNDWGSGARGGLGSNCAGIQKTDFQSSLGSWGKSLKLSKSAFSACHIFSHALSISLL